MTVSHRINKKMGAFIQDITGLPLSWSYGAELWQKVDAASNVGQRDDASNAITVFQGPIHLVHHVIRLWLCEW